MTNNTENPTYTIEFTYATNRFSFKSREFTCATQETLDVMREMEADGLIAILSVNKNVPKAAGAEIAIHIEVACKCGVYAKTFPYSNPLEIKENYPRIESFAGGLRRAGHLKHVKVVSSRNSVDITKLFL